jgi:TRAP-type C4-dicarboxylate transport system substrate-binding protein
VKVLAFWSHDHGVIHCRNKIESLADLQGQKLRFPTRLAGEALKAVGVAAVGMPVPQVPESLAQGVLDGAVVPWEVVPAIKLHELVKFHTEIPGTPTFYTATFFVVMNKAKYEGLPDDARKVIDETTGMALATEAGKMWDQAGADVRKMVEGKGNTILTLSEADKAAWMTASQNVTEAWVAEMKGKNIDAPALMESAKSLLAKYENA